jgi:hypothetical protein
VNPPTLRLQQHARLKRALDAYVDSHHDHGDRVNPSNPLRSADCTHLRPVFCFEDIDMYTRDVRLLRGSNWPNDSCISFGFKTVLSEHKGACGNYIALMDASVVSFMMCRSKSRTRRRWRPGGPAARPPARFRHRTGCAREGQHELCG